MHKYVQADYLARTRRIYPPHKFAQNETLHVTEYRLLKWSVYSCSARHCYKTAFTVRQLTKPGSRMPDQQTRIICERSGVLLAGSSGCTCGGISVPCIYSVSYTHLTLPTKVNV